jgi:hypothetical protein
MNSPTKEGLVIGGSPTWKPPLLMVIKTNGGQTGKFGAIFLIFIDEAQAA